MTIRQGDIYSSVHGETYDLILSQPPYYPRGAGNESGAEQTFLHGGEHVGLAPLVQQAIGAGLQLCGPLTREREWQEERRDDKKARLGETHATHRSASSGR